MRERKYSKLFIKATKKLKGQEARNLLKKRDEILNCGDLNFYKNLKHKLSQFKRVHVNNSYVILFFDKEDVVHFVDYVSHDEAYNHDKKTLKKYEELEFD